MIKGSSIYGAALSFLVLWLAAAGCGDKDSRRAVSDASTGEKVDETYSLQFKSNDGRDIEADCREADVDYIAKDDSIHTRKISIFLPKNADGKVPMLFCAHYETGQDSYLVRRALADGIAVASPAYFPADANATMTDDDLVFNNAALHYVRHLPEVDPTRVAVFGGSAGGYMTLMLEGLHMGLCAASASSPVANVYFNMAVHFQNANIENEKARQAGLNPPMSILGGIYPLFIPILENFDGDNDIARWEALSPVGLAQCISSPTLINHFTSDMLVPVDQVCKKFTYEEDGPSVPEEFTTRMSPDLPGILGRSFEEQIPQGRGVSRCSKIEDIDADIVHEYDPSVLINIDIYDDGPAEAYSSHRKIYGNGIIDDYPFLKDMVERSLSGTEILVPEKLILLLERYSGKSLQLPPRKGVDKTVYGSPQVYRKEIVEELALWASCHTFEELESGMAGAAGQDKDLTRTWKKVRRQVKKLF